MANAWFRMYAEFAHDPKVQSMSEAMQRRLTMLFCLRCSNDIATLHDDELAVALRVSEADLIETKAVFLRKGFVDDSWNLLNWDKRQFNSDSSTDRSRKHRASKRKDATDDATQRNVAATAPDTDTDTDTEKNKEPNGSVGGADRPGEKQQSENLPPLGDNAEGEENPEEGADAKGLPRCNFDAVVGLYHEILPELPRVRMPTDKRRKAVRKVWHWVLTSKKSDGTPRASTSDEAMAWLRGYFGRARQNDFLMGRGPRSAEHAGWQCSLDFLLTENGMTHVIEKTKGGAA